MENTFKKLEEYIYKNSDKESQAASSIACIVGVLEDIKPTAIVLILKGEDKTLGPLLDNLGLAHIFTEKKNLFISRTPKKALELKNLFEQLWNLTNKNSPEWKLCNEKIGILLGYPKTAVDYFNQRDKAEIESAENKARMERNHYYAHSPEHEEEEYQTYDKPLNLAIEKWSPKTALILKSSPKERWL